ncbi:hypothetical protein [Acetobacter conturbans]|uniref:Uncharacterized protein n=1 Tax=Acetobacter conturbans TaxID=1737472 RepID=A0ABX0K305_9PROT|nr:hypothetical protein [Acetobacter conturbans]NHN89196.1 hypothetical protein [Acetobacter conturbans]
MKNILASLCVLATMSSAAFADDVKVHSRDRAVQNVSDRSVDNQRSVSPTGNAACVKVWVNLQTHVYHLPGSFWYGATQHGKYMCMQQAVAAGNTQAMF